ncbi:MAG: UbiA family prenyltransferase, partial [Methanosarcina sp.]
KVNYLIKRRKYYHYILLFYLLITAAILVLVNNVGLIFYFIIITTGGVLYTVVFKELTKTIPGFKSLYVALLWAYHGTFFALFFYHINISYIILIITLFIFLKSLINATYFDLKDLDADMKEKLKTLPIIFGRNNTINILHVINTIAFILIIYSVYTKILPFYTIILSVFYFYTMYYLYKGKNAKRSDLLKYSYIMADSEFLLWPIALIICKSLLNWPV